MGTAVIPYGHERATNQDRRDNTDTRERETPVPADRKGIHPGRVAGYGIQRRRPVPRGIAVSVRACQETITRRRLDPSHRVPRPIRLSGRSGRGNHPDAYRGDRGNRRETHQVHAFRTDTRADASHGRQAAMCRASVGLVGDRWYDGCPTSSATA